jgi:type IX secretion system PorP/SprF family membrane protein
MPNIKIKTILFLAGWLTYSLSVGQQPFFTQYMDNPLVLNPALAGTRNALAFDLINRQQWLGVEGAPATYYFSAHSPINDTKTSLGGYLMSDMAGPVMYNSASAVYSYLVRINPSIFLSMGLSAGVENHWLGLNKLDVITPNDPHFSNGIENVFKPLVGAGLYLFSQEYYLGFSSAQLLSSNIALPYEKSAGYNLPKSYFLTAGAQWFINSDFSLKVAALSRISPESINTLDLSSQILLWNSLKLGGSYRVNNSAALILGVRCFESLWINYSYDFPLYGSSVHSISNQEITIAYDVFKFFLRNRDREFIKKKTADDPQFRSIRHF